MDDLSSDPIINVVHNGIKQGIRILFENNCYSAAAILVLSGIDTMAFLNMPEDQEEVTRKDFIEWTDRYIKFPCREQLTGMDLYGARCGMLHQYGTESKLSRQGACRRIVYVDDMEPEVIYRPEIDKNLIIVSIKALVDSFFQAVDRFLVDLYAQTDKARIANARFEKIIHTFPYNPSDISDDTS